MNPYRDKFCTDMQDSMQERILMESPSSTGRSFERDMRLPISAAPIENGPVYILAQMNAPLNLDSIHFPDMISPFWN